MLSQRCDVALYQPVFGKGERNGYWESEFIRNPWQCIRMVKKGQKNIQLVNYSSAARFHLIVEGFYDLVKNLGTSKM